VNAIGSIVLRSDKVKAWEHYARTLVPIGDVGPAEMYFDDYKPNLQAQGWFHGASFKVYARENLLKELYANGIGRMVEVWGYGLKQYFEGRVVEVIFNLPPDRFTKSLDQLANKTWMRADYNGDGTVDRTTVLQNADSQAKYGIMDMVLAGGEVQGLIVGDQAVQSFLDLRAFPKPAADFGGGTGRPYIELFCRGFIHTLSNQVYNQTANTGTQAMTAEVRDIIGYRAVDADSLLTNLEAWWDLEQTSDVSFAVFDLHGANNLTFAGVPRFATGIRGNGADLERADSSDLERSDTASLSTGDIDFSVVAWIKLESLPSVAGGFYTIAGKTANATEREWELCIDSANDKLEFLVYNAAGSVVGDTGSVDSALQVGVWYFVYAYHDSVNNKVGFRVNASSTNNEVATTGAPTDAASPFSIGARYAVSERFFDGVIDEVAFWKRLLTDAEVNRLYRDGMGMDYAMIQQAVAESGAGEFIASLDRGPNTTNVTKEYDADRKARDIIDDMAALGDADNNRWLVQGRGRTATSVKGRRLVFKQAAPVVVPPSI